MHTTQIFMTTARSRCLIFILSLTKFLHTWLLSNLTQVTMNTRNKLRLA